MAKREAALSTPKFVYNYAKSSMPRNPQGDIFPRLFKFTHKYCDQGIELTSTSGVPGKYVYSCNGMYDPNITGGGHQPYLFDQLSALYDQYCVIGSKITFTLINTTDSLVGADIALFVSDIAAPTAATLVQDAIEQGRKWLQLSATGGNKAVGKISATWSARKAFGKSPLTDDQLRGTVSANPVEQQFYQLWYVGSDNASTITLDLVTVVEYIAIWTENKILARS